MAFVDYNKVFNSLKHNFMFSAQRNQGRIPESYMKIIQEMYLLRGRIVSEITGVFERC